MSNNTFKLTYSTALSILILFVVANFLMLVPSLFDNSFLNEQNQINFLLIIQAFPFILTFIGIRFLFNTNRDSLKVEPVTSSLAVFFTSIALFFFTLMLNEYLVGLIPTKSYPYLEEVYKSFSKMFTTLKPMPVTLVFATCIFAPLLEEILFRGILLKGLLNNGKNPYMAIFFTSFLFGLVHGNPWQFIGGFTLGMVMGYIYYRTNSLLTTIFIHALNNSIAAYLLLMLDGFEVQEIKGITFFGALSIILVILALGSLLWLLTENTTKTIAAS